MTYLDQRFARLLRELYSSPTEIDLGFRTAKIARDQYVWLSTLRNSVGSILIECESSVEDGTGVS